MGDKPATSVELPIALSDKGGFLMSAAGRVPTSALTTYAAAYARRVLADLKEEENTEVDETSLKRLIDAAEVAAADVRTFAVLSQPGDDVAPVYTNEFAIVRTTSADSFTKHANEVMRLWNSANR
jgi:hypothetical protein